ncbi:flagellar hook-length control protein FliK [Anaerocolumna aminovalerica]|uniref:flagellar hook-length control protein FliK n=1 Tax=Anaerocolumna aminovalerica TaxID=1527 RepID=UPI001C0EF34F|nr:flagellar hook-length control protein FliK [Anaerocolumna aminovalerica]MBU5334571.1 flagellar hook-length control protein FliK [Anaerocolumna aminovalerica]
MINNNVSQSNINMGKAADSQPINSQSKLSSSVPPSPVSKSSYPLNNTIGLEKGQIIQGEVVDLRSNEVSVKLEDGRILTGKLEDGNHLAIGENVTFQVEEVSLKSLSLKILSESQAVLKDTTIDKALEAAGFSKNNKNRGIVKSLLNQQMPIDKNTIGLLIKQSIAFKDTPIDTLVFMNKYHIPVTKENIDSLKSLSNSEQNILNHIAELTNEIPNLLEELSNRSYGEIITKGNELLNIILQNPSLNDSIENKEMALTFPDTSSASEVSSVNRELPPLSLDSVYLNNTILSSNERLELTRFLEADPSAKSLFSEKLLEGIIDGTANMKEVAELLKEAFPSGSFQDNNNLMRDKIQSSIQHVLSAFEALQNNDPVNLINEYLTDADRIHLLQNLDGFSLPEEVNDQIQLGNISTNELLKWIQNKLSTTPESSIRRLFSSKEYKTLMKEELISKWTLTPNSLTKEGIVDDYYENLAKQLTDIKGFISSSFQGSQENLQGQAGHLQDNISFMNQINEFFTYFQLPIKLKEQVANSKLFVYTRKKERRTAEEGISVLLHLDMEHLGPLDIHVDLHNKNLVSRFYINDNDTSNLISSNMPLLEAALERKGYSLNAEVLIREKDMNIVEEFTKQEENTSFVPRYNFDIRA